MPTASRPHVTATTPPPSTAVWTDLLAREGERFEPNAHTQLLLHDPETVWFVETGGLLVFTAVIDTGEPRGTRTHLLDVGPGECVFGFDAIGIPDDIGVLAIHLDGTVLRRCTIERLRELARVDPHAIATGVDYWIDRVSSSLMRGASAPRLHHTVLAPHVPVELPALHRAAPATGVVWIDLPSASVLYNDLVAPTFPDASALFPVTPLASVMPMDLTNPRLGVTPLATVEVIGTAAMWDGLRVFQQTALRCEVMNRRLAVAEEFLRLEQKAHHSNAAQHRADSAIGAVLQQGGGGHAGAWTVPPPAEPVLWAAQFVGGALGMDLIAPAGDAVDVEFHDRVSLIASASGVRVRQVTLRDRWWQTDAGPLLARHGQGESPVALVPAGPAAYEIVNPATGERIRVDAAAAAQVLPLAYQFYRPLPNGPVSVRALIRFGARGVRKDVRWLLVTAVAIGVFGTVTPYLTGRIFDAAIPQSDKATLIGFAIALAGVAIGTAAFKLVQGIASIRMQARMEASIQAAVWDRLLQLPARFFRAYSAGDLADRAAGVDAIQTLITSVGMSAVLGAVSGLFFVAQMLTYHATLAWVGIGLTLIFVLTNVGINLMQVRYQRSEVMLRGRIAGLVLNLISGVTKVRTTRHRASRLPRLGGTVRRTTEHCVSRRPHQGGLDHLHRDLSGRGLDGALPGRDERQGRGRNHGRADRVHGGLHRLHDGVRPVPRRHAGARRRESPAARDRAALRAASQPILQTAPEVDAARVPPGALTGEHRAVARQLPLQRGRTVDSPRREPAD